MSVGAGLPTGPRSVVLAGGGTAGHVEPALALADALRRHDPDVAVTFLGVSTGLEARLVPARGYPLRLIPRVPLPRRPSGDLLTLPSRLAAAVREAAAVVADVSGDVVVGFGGYVAMPAYLGARRHHVPFVVHEANLRPGVANRFAARLTPYVAVSFPGVRLPHARLVGLPLRRSISSLDRAAERAAARASFGLDADRPTLLVFGGSQGARRINESVAAAARPLLDGGVQLLHAAGPGNRVEVERRADDPPYVVVEYLDRMDLAYAAADLALCRSGAMTVAEMTAVGLPAVFVPYPVGNGEQRLNAAPVVAAGGAVMVDDAALTAERVRAEVLPLVTDPPRLAAMARAAASLGRRDADDRLVLLVAEAAAAGRGRR